MKILLTGASSYVGARLYFDLQDKYETLGTFNASKLSDRFVRLDTTNKEEIQKVISNYQPDVILHAAANADARWCEANPEEAIAINQESAQQIVASANEIGAKIILISSFAAINPVNVYGKTKRISEDYVKKTKNGFVIIRPSLVIGFSPNTVNDRPFNRILKNLDHKTEAIYDTSWKFQSSYLGHISEVIMNVLERKIENEIIEVAVKELKNRYEVAKDLLKPFGIDVTPVDKKDTTPIITDNLEKLASLHLPQYSYEEIIEKIVKEIEQRNRFVL